MIIQCSYFCNLVYMIECNVEKVCLPLEHHFEQMFYIEVAAMGSICFDLAGYESPCCKVTTCLSLCSFRSGHRQVVDWRIREENMSCISLEK